jgi:hypothetical protein
VGLGAPNWSTRRWSAYIINGFWVGWWKGTGFSAVFTRLELDSLTIIHKRRSLGKLLGGRGQELLHEKP